MAQQTPQQCKANLVQQSISNQQKNLCSINQSQIAEKDLLSSKKKVQYNQSCLKNNQSQLSQYFDHLGGKCLCSLCNCGKHKCNNKNCINKHQLHGNYTIYQKEFVKKTQENGSKCNQNIFQQPKFTCNLANVTTYKHDFSGYNSKVDLQKNTSKPTVNGIPFSGISTYNNMYLNWGMGDTPQLLPQNNPTIIKEMPFMGKSIYKDSYQGTQTLNGQYNNEYHKEFDPKHLNQCPAKEVLEEVAKSTQF
ncbi:unnamed protein product [Paramecium pentaurelia]|uniref:STOP protein n=1 Tax=Paramecium pentaurelia TaxID=43138 RepID=A0A8S1SG81_9CILI|nr:unnamed protein product [Paramecium pentaurelia]